ncbi:ThuA domain-containing protein [Algoriphagus aquimarinus]|uniref:Glucose/arabinose dehydrogenase, beta-propeller fold n=1 Tax=Algoriphagus aquimarinus TaxID=237018 RepID=A0A1I0ZL10_9BACT|nr:ThuA domain-containing protein [Algoriphagus aquimarinus]SFB26345.1 Glucose/arabinose dehydrogenase, beta-propeller fold [Algoriphagus aquimarinus]
MNFPKNLRSLLLLGLIASVGFWSCNSRSGKPKVLVFSKTAGFHHESIPKGIDAIEKLGSENGFEVDTTTQSEMFTEENLAQYSAVIFLSTTGDVLNNYQEADFERYIQSGGGFMGIHAAADTEYEWSWYGRLVGGYFTDHPGINDPNPNVQAGEITVVDAKNSSTSFLTSPWARTDEWYSYKNMNPDVHVLLNLEEDSYKGGFDMGEHPIAWYHDYDGGRAFYTGGGHTNESYTEELFLKHVLAGIEYAIGDNSELDYSKAKSKRVPEENRFTKTTYAYGEFTEPTEMTILPNLDILVSQRRGEILLFDNETEELKEVAKLDVYWKTEVKGVNAEEGLMGIQKDPNFAKNGYVFVYYAPTGDEEINRLSRFTFKNDTWDMASEVVILDVHSDRDICCHTGGSIAFDKDGNLFLSLGDNSTPFNQADSKFINNGFAPLDQRPGKEQYDARRTSGNANDLRGKILRIKVKEDGSYDIPEGNLYPVGTEGTRPEIYVQGNRNPYRISIDQKNGFLYWGEVGPDANADSLETRGPRGYDELNQARKAGNFGWPYFVGNNYAYREFNYVTGESGAAFDPNGPKNTSVNNTGKTDLPALAPAFIWYPYGESKEFPQVGSGGRNAMAGPIYYSDMYTADTKLPDYYDGKIFIYDWIRGWIKAVTIKENGDFDKMEAFMPSTKFNALIDMEMGPDGRIYILEYGNGWFAKNKDSGLSRIDFNGGNRAPTVTKISADKTSGTNPLTVTFSATSSDPENDPMTYVWDLGNGETKTTETPSLTHTFNGIGEYEVKVTAKDPAGLTGTSTIASVYSGNVAPEVSISIDGNQSFYFPGKKVAYTVSVADADNPEAASDLSTLYISADYIEGLDMAESDMGHKVMTEAMMGKSLFTTLTCKTCHKEAEASVGPAYIDVAKKYNQRDIDYLKNKIKNGGGGVWGETAMPANPDMKDSDLNALVAYILSLDQVTTPSLPKSGSVDATAGKTPTTTGVLMLNASYTDQGGENTKPLSGSTTVLLKSNTIDMGITGDYTGGYSSMSYDGANLVMVPKNEASFGIKEIDLTGISSVTATTVTVGDLGDEYVFELRLDSPTGQVVGTETFVQQSTTGSASAPSYGQITIPITGTADGKLHKLIVITKPKNNGGNGTFIVAGMTFNAK